MMAGGSALHVTGTGSAFIADLYDCLHDLALPGASLAATALDPSSWSAVVETLAICPDLHALLASQWRPAASLAVVRAEPGRLPIRDAAIDAMLLGAAATPPRLLRGVLDDARRVLRHGGSLLIASPPVPSRLGRLPPWNAVAWCRLLEEHGFSVEKTLTTRPAAPRAGGQVSTLAVTSAAVVTTPQTRDGALTRHRWESLIVQARRW